MVSKAEKTEKDEFNIITYERARTEGWELLIGASLAYDKSIISLSTATLGFIFAVSTKEHIIKCRPLFILILIFLILTILISLLSFWFDQVTGSSMHSQAYNWYKNSGAYSFKKGWSYYASVTSKILSGALFIFSIILFTVLFTTNGYIS